MLTKKSVVLTGINDNSKKGVLSLEYDDGTLNGRLRLYNFSSEPNGILSLGITSDEGVVKAGLTRTSNMLFSFGTTVKEMPLDFSCAIVNFVGGQPSPILFGSCQGATDLEKALQEVVLSLGGTKNTNDVESVLDKFGVDYDDDLKEEIETQIDSCMAETETKQAVCDKNCETCMYKQYFYEHNESLVSSKSLEQEEQPKHTEEVEENISFYNEIKKQVDTLFAENKAEEYLEELIPNSKWVKVEFDEGGDYYVFGLIYEDDELKFVCYGVPGVYSKNPPKQLSGFPVWFAIDKEKQDGFGYWLSYQDAQTGESVKAIVE